MSKPLLILYLIAFLIRMESFGDLGSYLVYGFFGLYWIVAVGLGLARWIGKPLSPKGFPMALLVACLGGTMTGSLVEGHWKHSVVYPVGHQLMEQVSVYHQQHGEYPEHLTDLVPEFLESVPESGLGIFLSRPFEYHRRPKNRNCFLQLPEFKTGDRLYSDAEGWSPGS
ncbi:MAG: hypothetical protein ACPG31_08800 [Planctomycetota bacterium]